MEPLQDSSAFLNLIDEVLEPPLDGHLVVAKGDPYMLAQPHGRMGCPGPVNKCVRQEGLRPCGEVGRGDWREGIIENQELELRSKVDDNSLRLYWRQDGV
jgi:hypothetical protein